MAGEDERLILNNMVIGYSNITKTDSSDKKNGKNGNALSDNRLSTKITGHRNGDKLVRIVANSPLSRRTNNIPDPVASAFAKVFLKEEHYTTDLRTIRSELVYDVLVELNRELRHRLHPFVTDYNYSMRNYFTRKRFRQRDLPPTEFGPLSEYEEINPISHMVASYYLNLFFDPMLRDSADRCESLFELKLLLFADYNLNRYRSERKKEEVLATIDQGIFMFAVNSAKNL